MPDKRFSFDAFQSVTMTGEVLQAYHDKRTKHYPGRAFDTVANIAMGNQRPVWVGGVEQINVSLISDIHAAKQRFDEIGHPDAPYLDEHTWRFTPSSFRLILQDLSELNLLSLKIAEIEPDVGFELFVRLSRDTIQAPIDRREMLHRIAAEQVEGYIQLIRGKNGAFEDALPEGAPAMWRPGYMWKYDS